MSITRILAAIAILAAIGTAAASADECSDADVAERREIVIGFLDENPEKEPAFTALVESIEAEYGGEPSREQLCEAMDKIIAGLGKL